MQNNDVDRIPFEIEDFYQESESSDLIEYVESCPECGMSSLVRAGRCQTCMYCGYSACSL